MNPVSLPLRPALLALAVVAVWGTNFVVIKLALGALPPLSHQEFFSAYLLAAAARAVKDAGSIYQLVPPRRVAPTSCSRPSSSQTSARVS